MDTEINCSSILLDQKETQVFLDCRRPKLFFVCFFSRVMEKPPTTTVEGLRLALEGLGLSTKGQKAELKQRLRKAKKKLATEEKKEVEEIKTKYTRAFSLPF